MSNTKRHIKLAALPAFAALLLGSTAANADAIEGFIKSNLSPFGAPPVLKMERHNGQWRLKEGTVSIPISYRAEVSGPMRELVSIYIQVQHMAKGDGSLYALRTQLEEDQDAAWGNTNLLLSKPHLLPMEKLGKDVCASHTSPGTKSSSTSIPLTMWVNWYNAAAGAYSVGNQNTPIYTNIPATIECGPNPVSRPGGVVQETPDFKVKSIALNYGGAAPTKKNPTTECKSAKLTVSFNTTKAGVVDFRLHKKVGNAPIQAKNLQVYAQFDGNTHFVASYHEYIKVSQATLVQAMAEERVNAVSLSTGWKDVTLHCENVNGGYAGTPGNANPDGLPTKPKQPKRTVGGPSGETAGPNPTHAPFKPVIAPATVKTAPVPPKPTGAKKTSEASAKPLLVPAVQKARD